LVLLLAACSSGGNGEGGSSTTVTSTPLEISVSVIAPADVTYLSELAVGTTGYWTAYVVDDLGAFSLAEYARRLEVLGWSFGDVVDEATSIQGTQGDGWLDAVVQEGGEGEPTKAFVCVWNEEPDEGACAAVQGDRDQAVSTVPEDVDEA
jgi:hypothetical protein